MYFYLVLFDPAGHLMFDYRVRRKTGLVRVFEGQDDERPHRNVRSRDQMYFEFW